MSETPARQSQDSAVGKNARETPRETLKSLARKVLSRTVSGVSFPRGETARQFEDGETPARQSRDSDDHQVSIAIFETGEMRVIVTESETLKAIDDGGTIYSTADMYHYIQLDPRERHMLHEFKRRFGGTIEWKEND